ncbi:MAG TPA: hypothetical protein VF628_11025 [Allosphingosinicella sp.]
MPDPHIQFVEAVQSFLSAVTPAALGSAVYQAYQRGLGWRDRMIQFAVGICVSYFVTGIVIHAMGWSDFAAQGVGFVIALFAFEATPKFTRAAADAVAALPGQIGAWFGRKTGGKE